MHQKSTANTYEISGHGWMAGPYATLALSDHLFLQGRLAAGRSDNSVSPMMTYTDNFDSSRWLASGTVVGSWEYGPWTFRPAASFAYMQDRSDSYTDAFGVFIPGVTEQLGQAKIGPELFYEQKLANGAVVSPHAALQAIVNWGSSSIDTSVVGGAAAGPEGLRGKAAAGMTTRFTDGVTLDLSASYDGIGVGSYQALEGSAKLTVPLN